LIYACCWTLVATNEKLDLTLVVTKTKEIMTNFIEIENDQQNFLKPEISTDIL